MLGDPNFNNIDIEKILNKASLEKLSKKVDINKVYSSDNL